MAVAFGSIATSTTDGGNITITKPSGLSEGDLMIAILGAAEATSATTFSASGWAASTAVRTGGITFQYLTKVATSGDAAASNFTFTDSQPSDTNVGALLRITGADFDGSANVISIAEDSDNEPTTSTNTFSPGVTTSTASTLLIMGSVCGVTQVTPQSAYAVTTNNPTWTERADINNGDQTYDSSLAVATATYASAGSTGDFTIDYISDPGSDVVGFLIEIQESSDLSFTLDTAGVVTLSQGGSHDFQLGHTVSLDTAGSLTLDEGGDSTITGESRTVHTNQSKNSTSWTNQSKS